MSSATIIAWHRDQHKLGMQDPVYAQGYNSEKLDTNPYVFPEAISYERLMVSSVDRPLTEAEKDRLRKLNRMMEDTEWDRWSMGRHARYHCEYRLDLL